LSKVEKRSVLKFESLKKSYLVDSRVVYNIFDHG